MTSEFTPHKMKFLLSLSALLGLAAASSSCEDCTHLVTTMATYLTSEESMARQVELLLASVCPGTEDPDNCVAKLPEFWMAVGAVLWPGYYDPFAEWMCAKPDVCGAPEFKKRLSLKDLTCEECLQGIQASVDQMLSEEFMAGIVEALSGESFCGTMEDPALCAKAIAQLIPAALPVLAEAGAADTTTGPRLCNNALGHVCA